jgi:DNA-binding cell septation regulator SpoVG
MDITEVRVFPVNEEKLKAYVTITLDNCFVVRDLKVIHGNSGLFIAMPAKRRKDGSFKDIATRSLPVAHGATTSRRRPRDQEAPPRPPAPTPRIDGGRSR